MSVIKNRDLFKTLLLLTCFAIFIQILFLCINAFVNFVFLSSSLPLELFHSNFVVTAVLQLIGAHLLVYLFFISIIWYVSISIGELFSWRWSRTYTAGILLWFLSVFAVFAANMYFVPYSFFSILLREQVFHGQNSLVLKSILIITVSILLFAAFLTCINLFYRVYHKQHLRRHISVILSMAILVVIFIFDNRPAPNSISFAKKTKPNIVIIGIDAARPDFIGFYNNKKTHTPHIDTFLQSAIRFSQSYTPLARTFPSWVSLLTGTYPIHNRARGNNSYLDTLQFDESLPKRLQQAGYETIYSTDDTRFNNTDARFGFDQVITPPMGINDFLIGTVNDFPLTNLLIPTAIGKILFPYNYANHGAALTYSPSNYLQLLRNALRTRSQKPLFLAVHFTLTHWPFYWFNDNQALNQSEFYRYKAGIEAVDLQINEFFKLLNHNHLLDNTLVVLLSDHGIALGLPGDRNVNTHYYQGTPSDIKKLTVARYSKASSSSFDFQHDYGFDTSYGYGGDILSLSAYRTLLAFKGFGFSLGTTHTIRSPVSLIDIAPTLLDFLHLSPLKHGDGISLSSCFKSRERCFETKPLFLETSFSIEEIEKEGISVASVLKKTVQLYNIDKNSGLVFIDPATEKDMNQNKEFAILQGDWLLAQFPQTKRSKLKLSIHEKSVFENYILPPYIVLLNLKNGAWTTEFNTPLARQAPLKSLYSRLSHFYGNELGKKLIRTNP